MGDSRGCGKCCVLCQYFHFVVTVFGLFHCSPTSRDMLMLDVIEGCLGESNRSGWCSGYHARFTRERSRVQSSHPIFYFFSDLLCVILYRGICLFHSSSTHPFPIHITNTNTWINTKTQKRPNGHSILFREYTQYHCDAHLEPT